VEIRSVCFNKTSVSTHDEFITLKLMKTQVKVLVELFCNDQCNYP